MEYKFIFCGSEEVDDILEAPFKMYGGFTALENCKAELDSGSLFEKRNNMLIVDCGKFFGGWLYPSHRDLEFQMVMNVGGYYDNANYSTPVQMLNIISMGHVDARMNNANSDKRGWSIANVEIDGDNIRSDEIVSVKSSPNNTSGSSTYTSGSEFNIGLEAWTEGLTCGANYTISNSVTKEIKDWADVQKDPNSWVFKQQAPFDGTITGFPDGAADCDGVADLPTISKRCIYVDTNTVWHQHPAFNSKIVSISYKFNVTARYTWADEHSSTEWHAWSWRYWYPAWKTLYIALKNAYPTR